MHEDGDQSQDLVRIQTSRDTSWFWAAPLSWFSRAVLRRQLACFPFHCCHLPCPASFSLSLISAEQIVLLYPLPYIMSVK